MDDLVKIIWPILFVVFVAILLCLFIPILILLELFLILAGALILTAGGILITKEVVKLEDLWHRHKMKREYHELEICKFKRRHVLLRRHRRSIRDRDFGS